MESVSSGQDCHLFMLHAHIRLFPEEQVGNFPPELHDIYLTVEFETLSSSDQTEGPDSLRWCCETNSTLL